MDAVRIDRWLAAARVYKSRTMAQGACSAGHVKLNGANARSSQALRVGDQVEARAPRGALVLKVLALADKRLSPAKARELYEDHSPPPAPREPRFVQRERGTGRPTKAERRAMERFVNRRR